MLFGMAVAPAFADNYKILPPIDPNTQKPEDCVDKTSFLNRILTWDGKSGIKCSDRLKMDNSGNITAGTLTVMLKAGVGEACSPDGKIAQSKETSGLILSCQSGKWAKMAAVPASGSGGTYAKGTLGGTCEKMAPPYGPVYPATSCFIGPHTGCGYYTGAQPLTIFVTGCASGWSLVSLAGNNPYTHCNPINVCIKN